MWSIAYVIFLLLCIATAIAGMRGGELRKRKRHRMPQDTWDTERDTAPLRFSYGWRLRHARPRCCWR